MPWNMCAEDITHELADFSDSDIGDVLFTSPLYTRSPRSVSTCAVLPSLHSLCELATAPGARVGCRGGVQAAVRGAGHTALLCHLHVPSKQVLPSHAEATG